MVARSLGEAQQKNETIIDDQVSGKAYEVGDQFLVQYVSNKRPFPKASWESPCYVMDKASPSIYLVREKDEKGW